MFFDDLAQHGDNLALIDEEGVKPVTYSQLVENTDNLAKHIPPRSLAALFCSNCEEAVTGYVAMLRRRVTPLMVSDDIEDKLLTHLLDTYRPAYLYLPKSRLDQLNKIAQETPENTVFSGLTTVTSTGNYALVKTPYEIDYTLDPDLAVLVTTSGSTGSPKLVRQSYANLQSNTDSIVAYLDLGSDERAITTMPLNYVYGMSIVHTHLAVGAALILTTASLMEKRFWNTMRTQRATSFGGVPYMYEMLTKLRFFRMDLPDLRYMTQAGGKLSKELVQAFAEHCEKTGKKFIVMYGQSEATARMSYLPWKDAINKAGSIGIPIPNGRFLLIDEADNPVASSYTPGELVYFGANVTMGYAESRSDLANGDENHGCLHTGDIAERDPEGFYYVVGRKKRFLKLFGNRVNLDEVEGLLRAEGYDTVCVGVDDRMDIFTTHADAETQEKIRQFISHKTGIHPSAFVMHQIDAIPRNPSGKILYSVLMDSLKPKEEEKTQ